MEHEIIGREYLPYDAIEIGFPLIPVHGFPFRYRDSDGLVHEGRGRTLEAAIEKAEKFGYDVLRSQNLFM